MDNLMQAENAEVTKTKEDDIHYWLQCASLHQAAASMSQLTGEDWQVGLPYEDESHHYGHCSQKITPKHWRPRRNRKDL